MGFLIDGWTIRYLMWGWAITERKNIEQGFLIRQKFVQSQSASHPTPHPPSGKKILVERRKNIRKQQ